MKLSPIIETERLLLRKFDINDYKEVYDFSSNKVVQKYTGDKIINTTGEAKILLKMYGIMTIINMVMVDGL